MTRRCVTRKSIALLIVGIFFAFPWLSGYTFLQFMRMRYQVEIHGFWYPSYFPIGKFHINQVRAQWKDDFQILSGKLEVQYDPFLFSISRGGVAIYGQDLEVVVKKSNANLKVKGPFLVKRFEAEFELKPNTEPLIHRLEIDSPAIQFKISGQSE